MRFFFLIGASLVCLGKENIIDVLNTRLFHLYQGGHVIDGRKIWSAQRKPLTGSKQSNKFSHALSLPREVFEPRPLEVL